MDIISGARVFELFNACVLCYKNHRLGLSFLIFYAQSERKGSMQSRHFADATESAHAYGFELLYIFVTRILANR